MRAIISVIGRDQVGILAKVTAVCAAHKVNVVDVTQSVLREFFAMIMLVDISESELSLTDFGDEMNKVGEEMGMSIRVMHEDIFNVMHTI